MKPLKKYLKLILIYNMLGSIVERKIHIVV
jgi:hypothetical protein